MAGGTKQHAVNLLLNLDQNKFDIFFIYSNLRRCFSDQEKEKFLSAGIRLVDIPMTRGISAVNLRAIAKIRKILLQEKFSIIYTNSTIAGICGRLAAISAGTGRVVYSPHAYYFLISNFFPIRYALILLEKILSFFTDYYIAVSKSESGLTRRFITGTKIIYTINNFLPREIISGSRTKPTGISHDTVSDVLLVTRFKKQKRTELFIEIAEKLLEKKDLCIRIIGASEGSEKILRLIKKKNLQHKIFFHTEIRPPLLYTFIAGARILANVSRFEGLSYNMIEAFAFKKTFISFAVTGLQDAIKNNYNGFLIKDRDTSAFAEKILILLEQDSIRRRIGKNCFRAYKNKYSLPGNIKKYETVFARISRAAGLF